MTIVYAGGGAYLLPGAQVSLLAIAAPLVVTMLLPLGLGLLVRERWPAVGRVQPIMGEVSSVALIVVVIATTLANYEAIIGIGWRPRWPRSSSSVAPSSWVTSSVGSTRTTVR